MSNPDYLYSSSGSRNLDFVAWQSSDFKDISLPTRLPQTIPNSTYPLGSRCRWIPNPHTDWGTIIGQIYSPYRLGRSSEVRWSWLYLLLLDPDSPSQPWLVADWVEEEQLELLVSAPSENSDLEGFHEPSP